MRKSDDADEPSADEALQAEYFPKFFTAKISQIRKKPMGPQTQNIQATRGQIQHVSIDNRQTARGHDSSCSEQALFIRPRSKVADKKPCINAVAVFVDTV